MGWQRDAISSTDLQRHGGQFCHFWTAQCTGVFTAELDRRHSSNCNGLPAARRIEHATWRFTHGIDLIRAILVARNWAKPMSGAVSAPVYVMSRQAETLSMQNRAPCCSVHVAS
jgi:hypothetical protein